MSDKSEYRPSIEQLIEGNLGKEILAQASDIKRFGGTISFVIKKRLVGLMQVGDSAQHREWAKKELQMWDDFLNGLFCRSHDAQIEAPEKVEAAIKAANAILAPEPEDWRWRRFAGHS